MVCIKALGLGHIVLHVTKVLAQKYAFPCCCVLLLHQSLCMHAKTLSPYDVADIGPASQFSSGCCLCMPATTSIVVCLVQVLPCVLAAQSCCSDMLVGAEVGRKGFLLSVWVPDVWPIS